MKNIFKKYSKIVDGCRTLVLRFCEIKNNILTITDSRILIKVKIEDDLKLDNVNYYVDLDDIKHINYNEITFDKDQILFHDSWGTSDIKYNLKKEKDLQGCVYPDTDGLDKIINKKEYKNKIVLSKRLLKKLLSVLDDDDIVLEFTNSPSDPIKFNNSTWDDKITGLIMPKKQDGVKGVDI